MTKKQLKTHLNITENQYLGIDVIEGSFNLSDIKKIPKGFNPTVGGYLNLSSVTKIPKGFNPTVGGYLNLDTVTKIPKGFNPTVGGGLYLDSVTEIPKGFNPTVGCNLYSDLNIPYTKLGDNPIIWEDGKYILVDGIFTEVVYKKGNVYQVKKIGNPKEFYLVTDGTKWAHGDTLKEAYQDLVYKVTNRNKEDFEHLTLDSVLTFEESIACYRTITSACSFGTRDFVESNGFEETDRTIREIIELTKGSYGSDSFVKFFNWLKKTLDINRQVFYIIEVQ